MNGLAGILQRPWVWAYFATAAALSATMLVTGGQGGVELMQAAMAFAAFSVLVGIGQMFVITLGPGNIDLSIPATMTLAGTLALKFIDTQASLIIPGFLIAIMVGVAVGASNYALIRLLRIPPIIATLSSSFVIQSAAIWSNRGLRIKPPAILGDFATGSTFGIANVALVAIAAAVLAHFVLNRTLFGRWGLAIGQNENAARLAGVPISLMKLATYVQCAVLASICGFLLASFSGGAALNMGAEYLLVSIAVVVIGGTSVAGGYSNVPGIWGASLFLFLVVSMLNTYGLGAGIRLILTGIIIIAVVAVASSRKRV